MGEQLRTEITGLGSLIRSKLPSLASHCRGSIKIPPKQAQRVVLYLVAANWCSIISYLEVCRAFSISKSPRCLERFSLVGEVPGEDDLVTNGSSTPCNKDRAQRVKEQWQVKPSSFQKLPIPRQYPANTLPIPYQYPTNTQPIPNQYPTNTEPIPYQYPANTLPIPYRYPTNTLPIPYQHPTNTQPIPSQYPTNTQPIPNQYPTNTQPIPNQYPTNTQPIPYQCPVNTLPIPSQYPTNTLPIPS